MAAAVGAATVHRAEGPAAAVLGDELAVSDPDEPRALVRTLELAFERSDRRYERARAVAETCGPEAIAARVGELLSSAATGVSV